MHLHAVVCVPPCPPFPSVPNFAPLALGDLSWPGRVDDSGSPARPGSEAPDRKPPLDPPPSAIAHERCDRLRLPPPAPNMSLAIAQKKNAATRFEWWSVTCSHESWMPRCRVEPRCPESIRVKEGLS